MSDTATPRHCPEHILSGLAERGKGQVEVQTADVACLAVFVVCKGVDAVGETVACLFRGLEGDVRDYGLVGKDFRRKYIGWPLTLEYSC